MEIIFNLRRDGDRSLQLLIFGEELFVSATHLLVLITSQTFVHNVPSLPSDKVIRQLRISLQLQLQLFIVQRS